MNINLSSILVSIFLISCNQKLNKEYQKFDFLVKADKTIILSCTNCSCIINELNRFAESHKINSKELIIYGDTSCIYGLNNKISINYLSQSSIDSISTTFYNMLLIKRSGKKYTYKIIETKNSNLLTKYLVENE